MAPTLEDALNAIRNGNKTGAASMLATVVTSDPHNECAWLALASVLDDHDKKRQCLCRVLAINPNNSEAKVELSRLDVPPAAPAVASPPAAAPPSPASDTRGKRKRRLSKEAFWLVVIGTVAFMLVVANVALRVTGNGASGRSAPPPKTPAPTVIARPATISEALQSFMLTAQDLPPGFSLDRHDKLPANSTAYLTLLGGYLFQYQKNGGVGALPEGGVLVINKVWGCGSPEMAKYMLHTTSSSDLSNFNFGDASDETTQILMTPFTDEILAYHSESMLPFLNGHTIEKYYVAFRKANVMGSIFTEGWGGAVKAEDVVSMAKAMGAKIYPLEVPARAAQ